MVVEVLVVVIVEVLVVVEVVEVVEAESTPGATCFISRRPT